MSLYTAVVTWERNDSKFVDGRYSRAHRWRFDGGIELEASSSPHVVPLPLSREDAVDPEEAFVASLASCHMLWFLALAARNGFVVDAYRDEPSGVLEPDEVGLPAMTRVILRPQVAFSGEKRPSTARHTALHNDAHRQCFLARSVKTEIRCEPVDVTDASTRHEGF